MGERVIMRVRFGNAGLFCMLFPLGGILLYLLCGLAVGLHLITSDWIWSNSMLYSPRLIADALSFGNRLNYVLVPLIIALAVLGYSIHSRWEQQALTLTDRRIYGCDSSARHFEVYLDDISDVKRGLPGSIVIVTRTTRKLHFTLIQNRRHVIEQLTRHGNIK